MTWSELFFDLIFVVAIARFGENFRDALNDEDAASASWYEPLGDYAAYMLTILHVWYGLTQYMTRYGTDDMYHKLIVPFLMGGVVFQCALSGGGPSSEGNSSGFMYASAFVYAVQAALWLRVAFYLGGTVRAHALAFALFLTCFRAFFSLRSGNGWAWRTERLQCLLPFLPEWRTFGFTSYLFHACRKCTSHSTSSTTPSVSAAWRLLSSAK